MAQRLPAGSDNAPAAGGPESEGLDQLDLLEAMYDAQGYTPPPADGDPHEPTWVRFAHDVAIRLGLSKAAHAQPSSDVLALLTALDPDALAREAAGSHSRLGPSGRAAAGTLLDGIVAAQRLVNHVQAVQQRWTAAFCQPCVAIPLSDLVDLAGTDLTDALADAVDTAAGDTAAAAAVVTTGSAVDVAARDRDPGVLLSHPVWGSLLRDAAVRAAAAEVGCVLHLAPVTARIRCETAIDMVDTLPATLAAQYRGDIDGFRARLIAERTAMLSAHLRRRIEQHVLPVAHTRTAAGLRRLVDREVIAADPDAARKRCETARAGRAVTARRGEDDIGTFTAIVPAADSDTAYGVLDAIAARLAADGLADGRTRDQLRADAFTDLFHTLADTGHAHLAATRPDAAGHPGAGRDASGARPVPSGRAGGIVAVRRPVALNVYVDAATLAGLNEQPGELAGFGVITADTARALAASADTIRAILIRPTTAGTLRNDHAATRTETADRPPGPAAGPGHPSNVGSDGSLAGDGGIDVRRRACGSILDAGRAVYRPPDKVADYVTARDRTCRFPGCHAPATRCDLDHRTPFLGGGETCPHNLDTLCRTHHRLKTFTTWHATRDPNTDRLTWTSPLGHHHDTEPAHLLHDPLGGDDPPPF